MKNKVMVAGHICLDIAPRLPESLKGGFSKVFTPGKLINVGDAVISTGGAVSNTGLAMAKLGVDVLLNGKVGDDGFGNLIKELVGPQRAAAFKTVSQENSSYTIIIALPGIDRIFLHNPGTNDTFTSGDIDYTAAADCCLFHFGYPPLMKRMYENDGDQLVEMYKNIKKLGVTTSMDMSLPDPASDSGKVDWQKVLKKVLPYVDIFLPSIEETAFMIDRPLFEKRKNESGGDDPVFAYNTADYARLSGQLLDMGVKIAALKSGIRGYYLRTASAEKLKQIGTAAPEDLDAWAGKELWASSFKAEQFGSATGAGDATIAGFLCGLLRGFTPQDSLQLANTVGWQNVRAIDALSGIDDWQTTLDLINDKSRPRNPLDLGCDGWKYCEKTQVYYGPMDSAAK